MGELKNCPVCGKVFVKIVKNLCPACVEVEEREFMQVRDYIKNNPGASVDAIADVTGIEEKKILRWLREGRIEYSNSSGRFRPTCKNCGSAINLGDLCARCAKELSDKIRSMTDGQKTEKTKEESKEESTRRMYVANRARKD